MKKLKKLVAVLTLAVGVFLAGGYAVKAHAFGYFVSNRPAIFTNSYDEWYSSTTVKAYANIREAEGDCSTNIYARVYNYVDGKWVFEKSYDKSESVHNVMPTNYSRKDCLLTMNFSMRRGQKCQIQFHGHCFGVHQVDEEFFVK